MERLTAKEGRLTFTKSNVTDKEIAEKLYAYEEAEEQGRLHIAPCADSTEIWYVLKGGDEMLTYPDSYKFGQTEYCHGRQDEGWFLTRSEAEATLNKTL